MIKTTMKHDEDDDEGGEERKGTERKEERVFLIGALSLGERREREREREETMNAHTVGGR